MSPDLLRRKETSLTNIDSIINQIISNKSGHTGLTVSGGEPFDQAQALHSLLSHVKKHTTLDIIVYSGYTLHEILNGNPDMKMALSQVDILIDGRYREDLPTTKIWRGSSNQVLHLLSKRALKYNRYVDAEYGESRPLQVEMGEGKTLQIIGIPGRGDLNRLKELLFQRGITQKII